MNLKLIVFGYELGRLQVDLPDAGIPDEPERLVEGVVDAVSGWWVQRMMKRRSR